MEYNPKQKHIIMDSVKQTVNFAILKVFDSERGLGMQYRYWETLKIGMAVVMKETPFSGTKNFDDILGIFALYLLSKGILAHLSLLPSIG